MVLCSLFKFLCNFNIGYLFFPNVMFIWLCPKLYVVSMKNIHDSLNNKTKMNHSEKIVGNMYFIRTEECPIYIIMELHIYCKNICLIQSLKELWSLKCSSFNHFLSDKNFQSYKTQVDQIHATFPFTCGNSVEPRLYTYL